MLRGTSPWLASSTPLKAEVPYRNKGADSQTETFIERNQIIRHLWFVACIGRGDFTRRAP